MRLSEVKPASTGCVPSLGDSLCPCVPARVPLVAPPCSEPAAQHLPVSLPPALPLPSFLHKDPVRTWDPQVTQEVSHLKVLNFIPSAESPRPWQEAQLQLQGHR